MKRLLTPSQLRAVNEEIGRRLRSTLAPLPRDLCLIVAVFPLDGRRAIQTAELDHEQIQVLLSAGERD